MTDIPEKTIVGYADRTGVAPGECVRFMVSCYAPGDYGAEIVKLVCGDTSPRGAGFQETPVTSSVSGRYAGRAQPIHVGSYALIPVVPVTSSFSAQAMIWATTPHKGQPQAILSRGREAEAGFALCIAEDGSLAVVLRDGAGRVETRSTGRPLAWRQWTFVAVSYDAATGELRLHQEPWQPRASEAVISQSATFEERIDPAIEPRCAAPVLLAASAALPVTDLFNGKIDSPRLARRALSRNEMHELEAAEPPLPSTALAADLLCFWDLSRDISGFGVTDLSAGQHHGETQQLPTRAVTGFRWDGSEQDWKRAPLHYGAIHFHDDDLYDAGWDADFSLTVPDDWPSGIYAAKLTHGECDDYIPFIVRPPRGEARAKILFLASTATYMAYANERVHLSLLLASGKPPNQNDAMQRAHPEFGCSLYCYHSDGSGVHFSSLRRPVMNWKPKGRMWSFNADTNVTAWLERLGVDYDVASDEDLHAEGADLLRRYAVVVTGTHPEYHSTTMLDGLEDYLGSGGRLMYLGGNGFYWRVAFHPDKPGAIEVRRAEDGTRAWISQPGEYYHQWGGEYGGLWRRQNRPPNQLVGVGFAAQGFGKAGYYRRQPDSKDPRVSFIFEGVESDDLFGDYGRAGGAAGEEIDRFDPTIGTPAHTLILASSEGHDSQMLRVKEEFFMTTPPAADPFIRSDLVFFETPKDGAVFSTGSISWAAALSHAGYQNDVARITTNVLLRFADPRPFDAPAPTRGRPLLGVPRTTG